jgi:small nuclear ribonucleoprotein (snRNP)-like protein
MLEEFVGHKVVIDCRSEFIVLGLLKRYDEHFLELRNCDLHDLRDTDTTRENYTAESIASGVKRNRKRVLLNRGDVVAIALLEDVVDE